MNTVLLVQKIGRRVHDGGFWVTFLEGITRLKQMITRRGKDAFDLKHQGVDTAGVMPLWTVSVDSPNAKFGVQYGAVGEEPLRNALEFIEARENLDKFSFLDIGCGKGRPLLVASNFKFKNLIGVEFAHQLAEVARRNLRQLGIVNAIVEEGDASEYIFPNDDKVVFLYNPFLREVMEKMVNNLKNSRGRIFVIYIHPQEDCLPLYDFLTPLPFPGDYVKIWRSL